MRESLYFSGGMPINNILWQAPRIYANYVWLLCYQPDLWKLLTPYFEPAIARGCEDVIERNKDPSWRARESLDDLISNISEALTPNDHPELHEPYRRYLKISVVERLISFLKKYRGGGFAALMLLDAAREGRWEKYDSRYFSERYPNLSMFNFPCIPGADPLEVLRTIKKLNAFMRSKQKDEARSLKSYMSHFRQTWEWHAGSSSGFLQDLKRVFLNNDNEEPEYTDDPMIHRAELAKYGFPLGVCEYDITLNVESRSAAWRYDDDSISLVMNDVEILKWALNERWDWFSRHHQAAMNQWIRYDETTRAYLFARVCDLSTYNVSIANKSFPPSTFTGAEMVVSALTGLLEDTKAQIIQRITKKVLSVV
jgi:hypothetical protein